MVENKSTDTMAKILQVIINQMMNFIMLMVLKVQEKIKVNQEGNGGPNLKKISIMVCQQERITMPSVKKLHPQEIIL